MVLRILTLGALAAAVSAALPAPARAEFFTFEQMRGLCRGDTGEAPEFRTRASHLLLAQTHRARCRMYLLGQVDGYLQRRAEPQDRAQCLGTSASEAAVTEAIVEALLARADAPQGGIGELVRDVLRTRFGCA
jgi:hypothetical protein